MGFWANVGDAITRTVAAVVGVFSSAVILSSSPTQNGSKPTNTGYATSAYDYFSSGYNYLHSNGKCIHSCVIDSLESLPDSFKLSCSSFLQMTPLKQYPIPYDILAIQSNESTAQQILDLRYSQKWFFSGYNYLDIM